MELKRVVVTGLGALTPIGNSIPEFWDSLINGVSGAAPITHYDPEKFRTKFACEVKNFNPEDFLEKKEARKLDPFVHYAIAASDEAIKDAGLDFPNLDTNRIGVIWGSGIGGLKTFTDEVVNFAQGDGTPRFNPFFHSENDLGHCSWSHFNQAWLTRPEFFDCFCLCFFNKRPH